MGRLVILVAGLALAACASPQPERARLAEVRERLQRPFAEPLALALAGLDADGDLVTARAEMEAALPGLHRRGDADGSGAVEGAEWPGFARALMGRPDAIPGRISFDADADGAVSLAEFSDAMAREFARFDGNGDDALERAELVRTPPALEFDRRARPARFNRRAGGPRRW